MGSVWHLLPLMMLRGVLPLSVMADEPSFPRVRGVRVQPVLEGVDPRDPGQDADDALEVLATGTVGIGLVVELAQVRMREELHRHRRDLGELQRRVPVGDERIVLREHRVERVPRLVKHRLQVAVKAGRVHEDEGSF